MQLFKTRIRFKTQVRVNAPAPPMERGVAYHMENLARHRRKSAVAMHLTKILQVERHRTGLSNAQLWSSLFATLERV